VKEEHWERFILNVYSLLTISNRLEPSREFRENSRRVCEKGKSWRKCEIIVKGRKIRLWTVVLLIRVE
jgi:hypothetical protein